MSPKALEVNIASSRVHVTVDERYAVLQEVMGPYQGVKEELRTFLEELSHPYRNWEFIVKEARSYALNYFHVLREHERVPEAAGLYTEIFFQALDSTREDGVRANAADNLLLFIQKVISDAGDHLPNFLTALDNVFERIAREPQEIFHLFATSFYQMDKLGAMFCRAVSPEKSFTSVNCLLTKYYEYIYDYWLGQGNPILWFEKESGVSLEEKGLSAVFEPISHSTLKACREQLERIVQASEPPHEVLKKLVKIPGYGRIVDVYRVVPSQLSEAVSDPGEGNQWKLIFLLHIMNIAGLSAIHEEVLREINRTMAWLIRHQDIQTIKASLQKTFAILRTSERKFPGVSLNCVLNMGQGVYETDDSDLVDFFIESVISLGFESPHIQGVGEDWQIRANEAHIQNIRTWLQLIELNPKWSKKLLSSLIIHLCLGGVFIKDTDLFPRDVTRMLNSDIAPVYNLTKQLTRLFPVYFSDIGAEGILREISTKIDEVCLRRDPLAHFLRKQSHVESSNQIVGLMEGTLKFWETKDKEWVKPFVPPSIYEQIQAKGEYIDGVHQVLTQLQRAMAFTKTEDLLSVEEGSLRERLAEVSGGTDWDVERVELMVKLYKLLFQKYHLRFTELDGYLNQLQAGELPDLGALRDALAQKNAREKLVGILTYLEKLKDVILSPERYPVRENIYRKRHFTVDIPSMYGSYHEMKFDALGLTFRVEALVNVLFEELVETLDLGLITRATFSQIHDYLRLFDWALRLDGISSREMQVQLDLLARALEIRGFSSSQYLDIFRGFSQAVSNIVNDYFNNIHEENLLKILKQAPAEDFTPKYLPPAGVEDREKLEHRVTEIFLRDRIASSVGIQQLDVFLGRILNTLYRQSQKLPKGKLRLLLSYDPQRAVTPIMATKKGIADIIHLGNKGLNLVRLQRYGMPVPPGFIVTTEVFRCRDIVENYGPAKKNFREQVAVEVAAIERLTGRSFGDPGNPLLLSVRSGSSVSQPGMMNTFLDVGINEMLVEGMVARTGNEWFGWDTYRRFLQSYGMAFGLSRDDFDAIIADFKKRSGIPYKRDFSGNQMKDIALTYKTLIQDKGIEILDSPLEQLQIAIWKVSDSWHSTKAQTYRTIMGISDDWGTAVTVQAMVFGNLSQQAGSGVYFTHSPRWSGDMIMLWGDFTTGNQGEDVVSGLVRTFPISRRQAELENREDAGCLELQFPNIYRELRDWAKVLVYEKKWSPQEMEFTFETPDTKDLYFLQTRDMAMRERKKVYSFEVPPGERVQPIGHGIGVSGGAMAGRIVFSLEEIQHWRRLEPHTSLILVRGDTVPDDIREIYEADGLLTARGGSTSHAAIVAHRLGKTCVVGFADLICMEKDRACTLDQRPFHSGDWLSLDGSEGSVYMGKMEISEMENR